MKISELPYQQNSAKLFSLVADEPWSIFFDSGFPEIDMGRYDIIVSRPVITLETFGNITHINYNGKETTSSEDPFMLLNRYLGEKSINFNGVHVQSGATSSGATSGTSPSGAHSL